MWCRENLAPILKYHCKLQLPHSQSVAQEEAQTVNGGYYFLWAFGWPQLFLGGLNGCLDGSSSFPEGVGHNENVDAKTAKKKKAFDRQMPWHNLAHFRCAKSCHSECCVFLTPPPPVGQQRGLQAQ